MGKSSLILLLMRHNFKRNVVSLQSGHKKFLQSSIYQGLQPFRNYGTEAIKGVTFGYRSGLPVISVPLPSRSEQCSFALRPVSSTIGNFLASVKNEDKGIDRAQIYSQDGSRMAADTPIEYLLRDNFVLRINEESYEVEPPSVEKLSSEELQTLDHVKILISQLYSQLHIDQHQLSRERELLSRLEELKEQRKPFEEMKNELTDSATKRTRMLMWAGLAGMATQFGILARLTWWEYSWDIMEPVTYFITYGTAILMYGYFVLTQQEYIYPDARDRQYLRFFHKQASKVKFDIESYNRICDEIARAEQDLKRLRDPLQLQLPIDPIRTKEMEGVNEA